MQETDAIYYLNRDSRKEGPFTLDELGDHGIEPTSRVFKPGQRRFLDACEIPEISERYFSPEAEAARNAENRMKIALSAGTADEGSDLSVKAMAYRNEKERVDVALSFGTADEGTLSYADRWQEDTDDDGYVGASDQEESVPADIARLWATETGDPSEDKKEWYLIAEGRQEGPLELPELKQHGLTSHSKVWRAGMTEWTDAVLVPELARLVTPVTPPPFTPPSATPPPFVPGSKVPAQHDVPSHPVVSPELAAVTRQEITAPPSASPKPGCTFQNVEYKANFNDGMLSIGGKIIITRTQLIFRAHGFNFVNTPDKVFEIRDISGYKKGFLTILYITFRYGLTIKLAVSKKQEVINQLESRRKALQ